MLKRARISFGIASIAAIFGFTGILQAAAPVAQALCYLLMAFSGLSLLFSLFEEPSRPDFQILDIRLREPNPSGSYQLVLDFER
jgi:uncharacterized membrane protein YtjA (UPF0391 family)